MRTLPQSWPQLCGAVVAANLLLGTCALAQTAGDRRMSGGTGESVEAQAAYAGWRKLSQNEVNCVDQSLRGQGANLWALIQRGLGPSSSAGARALAACRTQARVPSGAATVVNATQALASGRESSVTVTTVTLPADKAAADKAAADKAVAEKAASEKAAADKAAAEKAAAVETAAKKAAADKAAAEQARLAAEKAQADKAAAEKTSMDWAKAEAQRAKAETLKTQTTVELPHSEPDKATLETAFANSAAESRLSFIYGLILGPMLAGLGGASFLLLRRRRHTATPRSDAVKQDEFDRLVAAVLAEVKRIDGKSSEAPPPDAERRPGEVALH